MSDQGMTQKEWGMEKAVAHSSSAGPEPREQVETFLRYAQHDYFCGGRHGGELEKRCDCGLFEVKQNLDRFFPASQQDRPKEQK